MAENEGHKRGRKTQYTDDDLVAVIIAYAKKHPGQKIGIDSLVAESGISRATWYRSAKARNKIAELNYAPALVEMEINSSLPTMSDVIKQCGDDVDKYKDVVKILLDTISTQAAEKKKTDAISPDDYEAVKEENKKLHQDLDKANKQIDKLNVRLNAVINHRDDLINLKDNIDKMDSRTFDEQFGDLFDD